MASSVQPEDVTEEVTEGDSHNKPCTLCKTPRSVLVRCQIDETGKWHFVCPGKCWNAVSGGAIDAKGHKDEHPYYRYGGMWKNRHADGPLNAKKPKKKNKKTREKVGTGGNGGQGQTAEDIDQESSGAQDEQTQ